MSGVTATSTVTRASLDTAHGSVMNAGAAPVSLLPEPHAAVPSLDDLSVLYIVHAKNAQLGLAEGTLRVKTAAHEREVRHQELLEAERKAIEEAREAANHHGFWDSIGSVLGTVAKIAGVVASIALAVCTAGAAAPIAALAIAGAVMSTASFVDSETHLLEKLGIDAKTAGWIDLGMSIGGAACSGGASIAGSASTVATTATIAAKTAEAGAHVVRAVDAIEQSRFKANEVDAMANGLAAQRAADRVQQRLVAFLDELKDSQASERRTMKTTQEVIETVDATALAAAR